MVLFKIIVWVFFVVDDLKMIWVSFLKFIIKHKIYLLNLNINLCFFIFKIVNKIIKINLKLILDLYIQKNIK